MRNGTRPPWSALGTSTRPKTPPLGLELWMLAGGYQHPPENAAASSGTLDAGRSENPLLASAKQRGTTTPIEASWTRARFVIRARQDATPVRVVE